MSSKTVSLYNLSINDVVTGVNTAGILYLWYEIQRVGYDLTSKLKETVSVLKILNTNVNVISQHFMNHLINHKVYLDNNDESENKSDLKDSSIDIKLLHEEMLKMRQEINNLKDEVSRLKGDNVDIDFDL